MPPVVRVVAVAGPPGCGKSSLVGLVAKQLGAAVLAFDEFETISRVSTEDLAAWQAGGGSLEALQIAGLAEVLQALKHGEAARVPSTGRVIAPAPLVLFEMPLGRAHAPTRDMIDAVVWIDLPPDIALARALLAICQAKPSHEWLIGYLNNYVRFTRTALLRQREQVRPGAELVLDGTRPLVELVAELTGWITPASQVAPKGWNPSCG